MSSSNNSHHTPPPPASLRPLSAWLDDCATDLTLSAPEFQRDASARHAMHLSLQCRPALPLRQSLWQRLSGGRSASWAAPLAWSGAGVCALLLVAASALLLLEPQGGDAGALNQTYASDFVPLVPPDRWASYLRESGQAPAWLVTTDMPRDRLALMGLPYDPGQAGDRVKAELLMHPSGDVLAVRFVR